MPRFQSSFNGHEIDGKTFLGCGLYSIKQTPKIGSGEGPAPKMEDVVTDPESGEETEAYDILDEVMQYFKANMVHKTFQVNGPGDRLALYLTCYVQQAIKRLWLSGKKGTRQHAKKVLIELAIETPVGPGHSSFPFNAFYPPVTPQMAAEVEQWLVYVKQLRLELSKRIIDRVFAFPEEDGTGNQHWLGFGQEEFLGYMFERGGVVEK